MFKKRKKVVKLKQIYDVQQTLYNYACHNTVLSALESLGI